MGQRKLTKRELQKVSRAVWYLRSLARVRGDKPYTTIVLNDLEAMASNGTTDGNPYIEPQPEIGEGYRRATESDVGRRDLEYFSNLKGNGWFARPVHGKPLESSYHYRVPIDRIPTDEDAKQRPTVMVRDSDAQPYKAAVLYGVKTASLNKFSVLKDEFWSCYCQARFPYPGELD
jgi:hypothetical protein